MSNPNGEFVCDICGRKFLVAASVRQHKRYSWRCKNKAAHKVYMETLEKNDGHFTRAEDTRGSSDVS